MRTLGQAPSEEDLALSAYMDFKSIQHAVRHIMSRSRSEFAQLDIDRAKHLIALLRIWSDTDPGEGYVLLGGKHIGEWFHVLGNHRLPLDTHRTFVWRAWGLNEELRNLLKLPGKMIGYADFMERELSAETSINPDAPEWKAVDKALEILIFYIPDERRDGPGTIAGFRL